MAKGFDCATALTATTIKPFAEQGYTFVGRYLADASSWKRLSPTEAKVISDAGLYIISFFERSADRVKAGASAGTEDGKLALKYAKEVGQVIGSTIYAAVDYDAPSSDFYAIEAYMRAFAKEISGYELGVYGKYEVVKSMYERGVAKKLMQTYAWSKGQKFDPISIYQYKNDIVVNGIGIDLDESNGDAGGWMLGMASKNTVLHERVYAENGVLKQAVKSDGSFDYSKSATDVRYIKFNKDTYKLKLVWAKGKTVSQLVKENNADYGFNFPFFFDGNPVADCRIGNTVLNQGYDTPKGAQQTKWHGFAYKNGQPMIGQIDVHGDFGADDFVVKTTSLLLNGKGEEVWDWYREQEGTASDIGKDTNGNYVRAQRTFIGLDAQGNLHLAVGDGRTKYDRGLDLQEMALYLKSKGCLIALNGDGGSSSVIADSTGSLGQNKGLEERAVNHAVLVYLQEVKVDELKVQRDKLDELNNQIEYMNTFVDGSGSGTEKWALNYLEQVYDIMLTKNLVKKV